MKGGALSCLFVLGISLPREGLAALPVYEERGRERERGVRGDGEGGLFADLRSSKLRFLSLSWFPFPSVFLLSHVTSCSNICFRY